MENVKDSIGEDNTLPGPQPATAQGQQPEPGDNAVTRMIAHVSSARQDDTW
jgi:hypothetical protein